MKRQRLSVGDTAFSVTNYVFLTLLSATFVIPFLVVLASSFVGESELIRRGNFILIPEQIDFSAYKVLLNKGSLLYNAYAVTILRTLIGTFLNLVMTAAMAYGLSNRSLPGRNAIIAMIFLTMWIDGGFVPNYLLMKGLHLLDTFWVMIMPGLINAWYLIIMRNFFMQIPKELEESATMDGASPLSVLIRIIFPLSMPTFATIGLFYAVYHWNAWVDAAIYINNVHLQPLQVFLRRIVLTMTAQDFISTAMSMTTFQKPSAAGLKSAVIILTTLPIICVYPFLQKHFVKGVLVGSVKG